MVNPGQPLFCFRKLFPDKRFKFGSGYYGVKASYPDGTASGLCFNEKIIKINEKAPFNLSLDIPEYSSTGGSEKYQIPRNGEKVTIDGFVAGNQGTSKLYYIKDNNSSTSFSFNSTEFGTDNYTFWAKDKKGCKSNQIKKSLSQPQAINVTSSSINPQCNKANSTNNAKLKGQISFSVSSGGIPNFYAECLNNSTNTKQAMAVTAVHHPLQAKLPAAIPFR
jgi:hypothetical protein